MVYISIQVNFDYVSVHMFGNCKNKIKNKKIYKFEHSFLVHLKKFHTLKRIFIHSFRFQGTISFSRNRLSRKDFSLFNPNTPNVSPRLDSWRKRKKKKKRKTWEQTTDETSKEKEKKSGKIETKARGKLENVKTERHRLHTYARCSYAWRRRDKGARVLGVRGTVDAGVAATVVVVVRCSHDDRSDQSSGSNAARDNSASNQV